MLRVIREVKVPVRYDKGEAFMQSDTDNAASLSGFAPKVSEFVACNGEVFDARGSQSRSPHWHAILRLSSL